MISIHSLNVENQYCRYYSLFINLHIFLERTLCMYHVIVLIHQSTSLLSRKATLKSNILIYYSHFFVKLRCYGCCQFDPLTFKQPSNYSFGWGTIYDFKKTEKE